MKNTQKKLIKILVKASKENNLDKVIEEFKEDIKEAFDPKVKSF